MASAFKTPRKENVRKNPPLLSPPEKEAALGRTSSLPKYLTESPIVSKITQRRHPVQRAPSRLYRAELKTNFSNTAKYSCPNTCIGPEFVVRASHPCKLLQLETRCSVNQKRQILVILLNGQKIEINCDSSLTTAGHVFEALVRSEGMGDNFMLGLAALVGGDFIFLHPDTRLRKIAPPTWGKDSLPSCSLTLYLRIKFFLPSLRGIRNWTMKHQLYLQLRRSLLEQQIVCDLTTYIMLGGLALQAEFGDYSVEEHGSSDYFFLEHYIPENQLERHGLKTELQEAHKRRKGLDPGRAEEQFVIQVQTLENYGYHFYHATMIKKDMKHADVRIAVNSEGIAVFKSENDNENETEKNIFLWKDIQKLWYSKHYFMLQPNSLGKASKQKYFMDFKKSFYVFHLATSHHQFVLKFRNTLSSLQPLSTQFGIKVKGSTNDMKCQHKTISAEEKCGTLQKGDVAQLHKVSSVLCDNTRANCKTLIVESDGKCNGSKRLILLGTCSVESIKDKENENPVKSMQVCEDTVPLRTSSLANNLVCRPRVKMGTKVLTCTAQRALFVSRCNIPEDTVSLPELSDGSPCETPPPEAYVINSSIKSIDEQFEIDFQESLSQSLLEKFDQMPYDEERHLKTVSISKDENGSLGIQITKHLDGGIYISDVLPDGPADKLGTVKKGDQLIAVDGNSLFNLKYEDVLRLLQLPNSEIKLLLSEPSMASYCASENFSHGTTTSKEMQEYNDIDVHKTVDNSLKEKELSLKGSIMNNTLVSLNTIEGKPVSLLVQCSEEDTFTKLKSSTFIETNNCEGIRSVCCVMPKDDDLDEFLEVKT